MKTMNNQFLVNISKTILSLFVLLFVTSSCSQDESMSESPDSEEILKEISVKVNSPIEIKQTSLRAIGEDQENAVQTVDVLAFRVGNDGKEYYDYNVKAKLTSTQVGKIYDLKMTVWTKSYQQRFVFITNAEAEVREFLSSKTSWKDTEKEAMLNLLNYSYENEGDKWNTTSADNYTAFPMWGESSTILVTTKTNQLSTTIYLLRMIAKIDVQIDTTVAGLTDKFKLTSVRFYNTNTKGSIAPYSENISADAKGVDKASIPSDAAIYLGPLEYNSSYFSTPGVAMKGVIYTFETSAEGAIGTADPSKATCLVLGGHYDGGAETFYRVDFLEDDDKTYRDILRNKLYTVNIKNVKTAGHGTPEEAFNGKSVNLDAEILEWDESGMNNIVVDNQFYLSVSQNEFFFSKEACDDEQSNNVLTVITDYFISASEQGWKIDKIVDENGDPIDWLESSKMSGDADDLTKLILTYDEFAGPDERVAKIHFSAGRLQYIVTVTQYFEQGATITFHEHKEQGRVDLEGVALLASDTLLFETDKVNVSHLNQLIYMKWTPQGADLKIMEERIPSTAYVKCHTSLDLGLQTTAPQAKDYSFKDLAVLPPTITQAEVNTDNFLERGVNLIFSVKNGFQEETKTLTIIQRFYNLVTTTSPNYPLNGVQQLFLVKSNTKWAVKSIIDNDGILLNKTEISKQTGGYNTIEGDPFYFQLINDDSKAGKSATIIFSDPAGKKGDTTVTINARKKD